MQTTQQTRYAAQFRLFSKLVKDTHSDYVGVAWSIAHKEGLEAAIAFCQTKINDSQVMQAYKELEEQDARPHHVASQMLQGMPELDPSLL